MRLVGIGLVGLGVLLVAMGVLGTYRRLWTGSIEERAGDVARRQGGGAGIGPGRR